MRARTTSRSSSSLAPLGPSPARLAELRAWVLEQLEREGAARVHELAAASAAPAPLVEGVLRALKRQGLARCAEEGSPPVVTWRAAG